MPYDFDDAFDRVALSQDEVLRRHRMREQAEATQKLEDEADAKRRAISTARTLENNRRQILAEYHRAGVAPPSVDDRGNPTASLSMLLRLGWRIEEMGADHVLIAPENGKKQRKRKTREEHAAEQREMG